MTKYKCTNCGNRVPETKIEFSTQGWICKRCINADKNAYILIPKSEVSNFVLPESGKKRKYKVCIYCKQKKLVNEYETRKTRGFSYLRSYCKPCHREYNRVYRQKNKAKNAAYMRAYRKRKTWERRLH